MVTLEHLDALRAKVKQQELERDAWYEICLRGVCVMQELINNTCENMHTEEYPMIVRAVLTRNDYTRWHWGLALEIVDHRWPDDHTYPNNKTWLYVALTHDEGWIITNPRDWRYAMEDKFPKVYERYANKNHVPLMVLVQIMVNYAAVHQHG